MAWADAGAPQGDPKDMTPARRLCRRLVDSETRHGLRTARAFPIPASGTIEYQKVIVPTGFTEDNWVQFAEARPDDRARIHHMIAYVREPGLAWLKDAQPGVFFVETNPKDGEQPDTTPCPATSWWDTRPASRRTFRRARRS